MLEQLPTLLINYFLYLGLASVAVLFWVGSGVQVVRSITAISSIYLKLAISGFVGLMLWIVLLNLASYLVAVPVSLSVVTAVFGLFSGLSIWKNWRNLIARLRTRKSHDLWMFVAVAVFLSSSLFLATYSQINFDEDLHVPVVASIIEGNFPIRQPTFPFWMRHFDYHYGWQLGAAAIGSVLGLEAQIALDIVKMAALILGIFLVWGLVELYCQRPIARFFVATSFFLMGPFWFFRDAFTQQYIYAKTQDIVGFSLFHNLQAVSWASVFTYLAAIYLIWQIGLLERVSFGRKLFIASTLCFYLLGMALTGEFQFLMLAAIVGTIHFFVCIGEWRARGWRLASRSPSVVIIVCVLAALGLSTVQGGVMTGLNKSNVVLDPSYSTGILYLQNDINRQQAEPIESIAQKTGIGVESGRPVVSVKSVKDFGYAPSDETYFGLRAWRRLLPAMGVQLIFIVPIAAWSVWFVAKAARAGRKDFPVYLAWTVAVFILVPLFLTTRYGDQNLNRGWVIANAVMYCGMVATIFRLRFGLAAVGLKTVLLAVTVMSWIPTLVFNLGVGLYHPQLTTYSRTQLLNEHQRNNVYDPDIELEKRFFGEVRRAKLSGWVLTETEESRYFSEQTGQLTFGDAFRTRPNIAKTLITDLRPNHLKAINATYVYVNRRVRAGLSSTGQDNLRKHFTEVVSVGEGDNRFSLYRLGG